MEFYNVEPYTPTKEELEEALCDSEGMSKKALERQKYFVNGRFSRRAYREAKRMEDELWRFDDRHESLTRKRRRAYDDQA